MLSSPSPKEDRRRGGVAVLNLLNQDLTYATKPDFNARLVRRLRLGGALELYVPGMSPFEHFDHLLRAIVSADRLFHSEEGEVEEDPTHHFGMEMSILSLPALRAGYDLEQLTITGWFDF